MHMNPNLDLGLSCETAVAVLLGISCRSARSMSMHSTRTPYTTMNYTIQIHVHLTRFLMMLDKDKQSCGVPYQSELHPMPSKRPSSSWQ